MSKRMREPCPSTPFGWDFNSLKVFQSDNLMYICPENSTIHPYFLQNDSQFLGGEFLFCGTINTLSVKGLASFSTSCRPAWSSPTLWPCMLFSSPPKCIIYNKRQSDQTKNLQAQAYRLIGWLCPCQHIQTLVSQPFLYTTRVTVQYMQYDI